MSNSTRFPFQISTLKKFFKNEFDPKMVSRIARATKLIKRSTSKINGSELLNTLLESALNPKIYSLEGLSDGMSKYNSNTEMTKQGLSQRINTPECVRFFESIYKKCLSVMIHKISSEINSMSNLNRVSLLNLFDRVIVMDSTEFPLHHSLKNTFKGSGGNLGNASTMKICASFDVKANCMIDAKITDRRCPDQGLGKSSIPMIKKNDLVMFDLGFFSIDIFEGIQSQGGYYISRLHGGVNIYENAADATFLDVGDYLEKKLKNRNCLDTYVYLGKEKVPVRLVSVRADKKTIAQREKNYRERCRKDKRPPTEENLKRLRFNIFITNISPTTVVAWGIIVLIKIRWQIELIFKNWKSQLDIDYLPGRNIHRIMTLILSRLIAISIIWILSGYVGRYLEIYCDEELSMTKSINWLKRECRFRRVLQGKVEEVLHEFLRSAEKWLCKEESPKKRTTRQLIDEIDCTDYKDVIGF